MAGVMSRIAAILLLFILLIDAPHIRNEPPLPRGTLTLNTTPIVVSIDSALHGYGPLRLYNLWQLSSDNRHFGGISSMFATDDGRLTALSDTGEYFEFGIAQYEVPDTIAALPRRQAEQFVPNWRWDSESLARDPASGRIWVGFERLQRICRYSRNFERIERCVEPREMRDWQENGSIESLVRFSDGRFMAIAEKTDRTDGMHEVLLWAADPTEPGTPAPLHLRYAPPAGYLPSDALWLGGDRLLVMNRRLTIYSGFTARLVTVKLPRLVAGAVLRGTTVADFGWPNPTDNLEAMALGNDEKGPVLWIASDDNHLFLQRTLLFKFALPPGWVTTSAAPPSTPAAPAPAPVTAPAGAATSAPAAQ